MSDGKPKRAALAYENDAFVNSPDGRILRIMPEYVEPLARFRHEQIQDTVVFFGSARFPSMADAPLPVPHLPSASAEGTRKPAHAARAPASHYEHARRTTCRLTP